jgi:ubiquinone/menaquinone biosynthesis C-methylase UbiE
MKVRDSGMPEEDLWNSFFDVNKILSELEINSKISHIVEIGCGYGTFTFEVSNRINHTLYAFDIENQMINHIQSKISKRNLKNIKLFNLDVLEETTKLNAESIDYVMLFNILHNEQPQLFFEEAYRILKKGGKIGIIHWRSDIKTPRGPTLNIRLKPEEIIEILDTNQFEILKKTFIIEPFHFGILLCKK